jgi:hypothetical protein
MKPKHILHVALAVFAMFAGSNIGQAIYAKYLKPKAA